MSTVGQGIAAGVASVGGLVTLPPGVTVQPGRETSQVDGQGAVVQGMVFPVKLANGSTTSVFVAYSQIHNTAQIEADVRARVAAIQAITG